MSDDRRTVYLPLYFGRWPEDGEEVGNVYFDRGDAKEAAENQTDTERHRSWHGSTVIERELYE